MAREQKNMPTLSDIGSYASIAGFIISIAVLILTYRINKTIRLHVRVPELIKNISSQASKLKKYGRNFENSRLLIREELSLLEANLVALSQKDRKARGSVDRVLNAISTYKENLADKERFLQVHGELVYLLGTVKNVHEDRLMER